MVGLLVFPEPVLGYKINYIVFENVCIFNLNGKVYKFSFKKSSWLVYESPRQYRQWVQLWNEVEDENKMEAY